MRNFLASFLKFFVVLFIIVGAWLLFKSGPFQKGEQKTDESAQLSLQANMLRSHLLKYSSPQKVQINNLTQRLATNVEEIKKIKIPLKPDSAFYISIDLFTDEHDATAPLVAQIQFLDSKSDNKIKEESINLE